MTELLHKRTFTQKHYDMGNNQYRLNAHIGHIHYQDGPVKNGAFHDIDTTLNYNPVSKLYSMTNASYEAEIGLNGRIRFHNVDHSMEFELQNPNKVEAEPYLGSKFGELGKALIWKNIIQDGGHQIVEVKNGSLAKIFRFDKKPLSNVIDFNVSVSDIQLDNDIDLIEKNHQIGSRDRKSFIRKPRAWNHRGESIDIRLIIRKNGTAQKIVPQKFIDETFTELGAWLECDTTTSYYAGAGDGLCTVTTGTWAQIRSSAGEWVDAGYTNLPWRVRMTVSNQLSRLFLPTDTSGIPDSAIITDAVFYLSTNGQLPGARTITLILTTQSDPTTLAIGDYDNLTLDSPVEGASRVNITANSTIGLTMNSSGLSWINKTGYTLLGIREGSKDIDNVEPVDNAGTYIKASQDATIGLRPRLDVTYSLPTIWLDGRASIQSFRNINHKYVINYSPAINNGGFETVGSPFAIWGIGELGGGATIEDTNDSHSGTHAMKIYSPTNGYGYINNDCLISGKHYNLSYWAKTTSGTRALATTFGNDDYGDGWAQTITDTWTKYTRTNVEATRTAFRVGFDFDDGTIICDDFIIEQID
jgi:hypothetical protein